LTDTDKTVQENTQTKYNAKKQPTHNTAKNYRGSAASYNTWPGTEVGLFYNVPEPCNQWDETKALKKRRW